MSVALSHPGLGTALVVFVAALVLGVALTTLAVSWTERRGILDHPNARSSHARPTPRGGGVSIVALTLVAELVAWRMGLLSGRAAIALLAGGALVAAAGAWDDLRSISVRARFPVQVLAATTAVVALASGGSASAWTGPIVGAIAIVALVWMTNLYNFMDGIDGIAGAQGVAAGLGAAAVLLTLGSWGLALVALATAGACAGFLTRNWSPARIFMGDVGSGFLGFTFGTLTWAAVRAHGAAGCWLLLPLLPFIVDATATLLRRAARGAAVTEAHREHLYQRAVIAGVPHAAVATSYGVIALLLAAVAAAGARLPLRLGVAVASGTVVTLVLLYAAALALLGARKPSPSA